MCLLSWANAMKPILPLITAPQSPRDKYEFEGDHSYVRSKDLNSAKADAEISIQTNQDPARQQDGYDVGFISEKINNEQGLHEQSRDNKLKAITKHLSTFSETFSCDFLA